VQSTAKITLKKEKGTILSILQQRSCHAVFCQIRGVKALVDAQKALTRAF